MRLDLERLENEISPLLEVHGVELVALEWLKGPGHGILRVYIDRPGGDPRDQDPDKSVSLEQVTNVTKDVSAMLDALDLIEVAYTLELGSPGPERLVRRREDFDRFAGLTARLDAREAISSKSAFNGTLCGTVDHPGGFAVRIDVAGKVYEVPAASLSRAKLHAIKPPPKAKPGKGTSKRQERLAAREQSRAINAAHLAARAVGDAVTTSDDTAIRPTSHEAATPSPHQARGAKR